jgi:hypothetical protein
MRTTSVVQVIIDGDTITVDGAVLPWDPATDARSPYDVTLAALATSATRWRPVRAEITETSGITRCQVLRDGTTENLRFTYTGGVGAVDLPPVPMVAATRSLVQARARRLPPVPSRFAVTGLGIVCLVGLVALGVHQMALPGRPVDDVRITAASPTSPVTQPLEPGSPFRPLPPLRVEAVPAIGGIEFRGERLRVVVVIDGVSHRLRLNHDGVLLDGLTAGSHDWTASGPARLDASGTTDVLSQPAPTTSTTPTPEPPATQQTFAPPIDPDRTH